MQRERVSGVVTIEEIKKWTTGDTITITAGTGAGKSYFIKNVLYAFAKNNNKKILMLIHRTNCVNQFLEEIKRDKKTDVIDIKTYQKLEWNNLNKIKDDLSKYQYIVCDEFHYFISDAAYNKNTDISLNLILSQQNSIKIFMSATGDYVKKYINNKKNIETIDYELPIHFNFIKTLMFFNKDSTLEEFIKKAIKKDDKGIFFIESAEKAYNLYKKFKKHCIFNCSKSHKLYKYVNKEEINKMLINERFEKNILITTTCLDAGVNIKDLEVKHIVVDVKDVGVLIQCIGRKRIQNEDDKVNVYIKTINNKTLGGMKTQLKDKLSKSIYLRKHTIQEFVEKYGRDSYDNLIYDVTTNDNDTCTKKLNELMYFKCLIDIATIQKMLSYKKYGYSKYLAKMFEKEFNYNVLGEEIYKKKLEDYLESIAGKKLFKDEQKELKDVFEKNGLKARSLGINTLNGYLKDKKLNFIIIAKMTSKIVNGKKKNKRYWQIINNVDI